MFLVYLLGFEGFADGVFRTRGSLFGQALAKLKAFLNDEFCP